MGEGKDTKRRVFEVRLVTAVTAAMTPMVGVSSSFSSSSSGSFCLLFRHALGRRKEWREKEGGREGGREKEA